MSRLKVLDNVTERLQETQRLQQRDDGGDASPPQPAAGESVDLANVELENVSTGRRLTVDAVREKLAGAEGPEMWRSLEELAETPEFEEMLHREFPRQASQWAGGEVSRRRFLQVMSASLALGGLTGCVNQPREEIIPYVDQPEGLVAGEPWYFATTHTLNGYGVGVLAESHEGRPTKIEGNPDHPASLGATDVFAQASVLDLYDPDRAQALKKLGRVTTWDRLTEELGGALNAQSALQGAGVRLLTGAVSSPTLLGQIEEMLQANPQAKWHVWEPAAADGAGAGTRRALGSPRQAVYDLEAADAVLTLDSDFLTTGPGALAYARQFTARRRAWDGAGEMAPADAARAGGGQGGNGGDRADAAGREMIRLYSVESTPTSTGTLADHRLTLPPSQVTAFARALAAELGAGAGGDAGGAVPRFSKPRAAKWVREVAADLRSRGGAALVVPGDYASAEVHELAARINQALGAVGTTVRYREPVVAAAGGTAGTLEELVADLAAGSVDLLVITGTNPVQTAPADLDFTAVIENARLRVYHGLYEDETSRYCQWVVPAQHYLESWGDAVAFDGTVSLVQPLISPLYDAAKSEIELVAALAGTPGASNPAASGYELVREHWQGEAGAGGDAFEDSWKQSLHDGVLRAAGAGAGAAAGDSGAAAQLGGATPSGDEDGVAGPTLGTAASVASVQAVNEMERHEPDAAGTATLEVNLRPDPTVWDGRYANNAWLQEIPKPITKLVWDNALLISPATAASFDLASNDLVELAFKGRTLQVPVWIVPAHADGCATLHLGYGRRNAGRVGDGIGFDAGAIRTSDALWTLPAVQVRRMGGTYPLACTQDHHSMEGRHLVRTGTLATYQANPDFVHQMGHVPNLTMYPPHEYEGYSWGMAVDLNACTGCNACVVACQSENNVPVVGKDQVLNGREMHWIRLDRYYEGSMEEPRMHNQPVMCQHCELAPCEVVCPVAATVHSDEGTNDMVYNRCVGTRYCSNNCPYKVRRFNFFQYVDDKTEVLKAVRNPDVTVRNRGVMEKCSYCIQRIAKARIASKREQRELRDGEIVSACQQACPSDAIAFGNVNDPDSRVSRWKEQMLNYGLLEELNTRPRTSYLAKLSNPNEQLAEPRAGELTA